MIQISISSDAHAEGKSTVAGIIEDALERFGYDVELVPILQGCSPQQAREFAAAEFKLVAEAQHWARACSPAQDSHPKAGVSLVVQG